MENKTTSKSLFWKDKKTLVRSFDENGKPAHGVRIFKKENGEKVITRFLNGLLDGDFLEDGIKQVTQPAVECEGHVEYWRKGMLHRDNGLPAVSTNGFTEEEWWENNNRIK